MRWAPSRPRRDDNSVGRPIISVDNPVRPRASSLFQSILVNVKWACTKASTLSLSFKPIATGAMNLRLRINLILIPSSPLVTILMQERRRAAGDRQKSAFRARSFMSGPGPHEVRTRTSMARPATRNDAPNWSGWRLSFRFGSGPRTGLQISSAIGPVFTSRCSKGRQLTIRNSSAVSPRAFGPLQEKMSNFRGAIAILHACKIPSRG